MADKTWKAFERRCCYDFGSRRIPVTAERHGADGQTELFAFQYKLRRAIPSWLFEWLGGIVATAARSNRIGVLVMKRPGMEDGDALVMLRYRDWVDLHGTSAFAEQAHRAARREQDRTRRARA